MTGEAFIALTDSYVMCLRTSCENTDSHSHMLRTKHTTPNLPLTKALKHPHFFPVKKGVTMAAGPATVSMPLS